MGVCAAHQWLKECLLARALPRRRFFPQGIQGSSRFHRKICRIRESRSRSCTTFVFRFPNVSDQKTRFIRKRVIFSKKTAKSVGICLKFLISNGSEILKIFWAIWLKKKPDLIVLYIRRPVFLFLKWMILLSRRITHSRLHSGVRL